jgi:multiple sugar transport system substrate-binding protein
MRLRTVAAVVAAGSLAVATTGCGSDSSAMPTDPNKVAGAVTMWAYPINPTIENTWWAPRVAAFQKTYPNVKVNVVVQPWANRDEQLTTSIAGGPAPDVVYLIPDQISQYAAQGALADVADALTDKADFRPNTIKAMTYDNTLYGVPLLMSVTTTLANKAILKAAGVGDVPRTWDDVLAAAPKIKQAGYTVTEYNATKDYTLNQSFYPLLWEAGGDVLSADGKKAAFNGPAGLAALEFVKKLVDGGYAPKDELTVSPKPNDTLQCQNKSALSLFVSPGTLSTCPGLDLTNWAAGPPMKNRTSISYGTVGGLSVLAGSKHQAAAKAWVSWLTAPAQMKTFDADHLYSAPRTSVGALYAGKPVNGDAEKYLDAMKFGVISPQARQIMELVRPHVQAALLGQEQPQAALDAAAKDVDGLLARNG